MPNFAQKLSEVRKQQHMTQEQLAEQMNVSRTSISRWESGRSLPDYDAIRQLSQVLNYDFFADASMVAEASVPTDEAAVQDAVPMQTADHTQPAPSKRRFLLPGLIGAAVLCVALVVLGLTLGGSKAAPQAHVVISTAENPVHAIYFDEFPDGIGWFYTFDFAETAGVPFTVENLSQTLVADNGTENVMNYTSDDVASWWGSNTLTNGMPQSMGGGFPLQNVAQVRVTVTGKDANGHELSFEGAVDLSKEVAE